MDFEQAWERYLDTGTVTEEQAVAVDGSLDEALDVALERLRKEAEDRGGAETAIAELSGLARFLNLVARYRPSVVERFSRTVLEEPFLLGRIARSLGGTVSLSVSTGATVSISYPPDPI